MKTKKTKKKIPNKATIRKAMRKCSSPPKVKRDLQLDENLGVIMAHCNANNIICLKHPKYSAKKVPSAKCNFIGDGCTCHIYWTFLNKVTEIEDLRDQMEGEYPIPAKRKRRKTPTQHH